MDIFTLVLLFQNLGVGYAFGKFSVYMEEKCGQTVYVDVFGKHSGRLRPTRTTTYKPNMNCGLTLQTAESHRFVIIFRRLDIEYEPFCDDDYLQIYDGNTTTSPILTGLPRKLCGDETPKGDYVSSGSMLTVYFRSDSWAHGNGYDLIFTIFHTGRCVEGESRCDNARCISAYMECDGWNNCGDNSDECPLSTAIIIAVILSVIFFSLIATSFVMCVRRKRRRKSREDTTEDPFTWSIHKHIHMLHTLGQAEHAEHHAEHRAEHHAEHHAEQKLDRKAEDVRPRISTGLPW